MPARAAQRIYLDHSATTPVRAEVREAMAPFLADRFGNAGSLHADGRRARRAVDDARDHVAALFGVAPREVVFTSGGTEANNAALWGVALAAKRKGANLVMSAIEHHAVLHPAARLAEVFGIDVRHVPVSTEGCVDPAAVEAAIDDRTLLVSIMHANNETGAIQPIEACAALCTDRGVPFHTDAVQSAGRLPLEFGALPVAMATISGHKLYGPKGIGALYVRKGLECAPFHTGGAQEAGRRAGTENVAAIAGFGEACRLARAERDAEAARQRALRDHFEEALLDQVPGSHRNGPRDARLPHIANIGFDGVDGESLLLALDFAGISASNGAACTSGALDPSHVLLAMGHSVERAQSAIRFSLGRGTTTSQIDSAIPRIADTIARIRATGPTAAA